MRTNTGMKWLSQLTTMVQNTYILQEVKSRAASLFVLICKASVTIILKLGKCKVKERFRISICQYVYRNSLFYTFKC